MRMRVTQRVGDFTGDPQRLVHRKLLLPTEPVP